MDFAKARGKAVFSISVVPVGISDGNGMLKAAFARAKWLRARPKLM